MFYKFCLKQNSYWFICNIIEKNGPTIFRDTHGNYLQYNDKSHNDGRLVDHFHAFVLKITLIITIYLVIISYFLYKGVQRHEEWSASLPFT